MLSLVEKVIDSHYVLVVGAAIFDTKSKAAAAILPRTSSPGNIRVSAGGAGRNIAENLSRLGVSTVFLSVVGDDEAGYRILDQAKECGIDTTHVIFSNKYHTAAYSAIFDQDNSLFVAIDDTTVMAEITPTIIYGHRGLIKKASIMVMDASLSPESIKTLLRLAKKYDIPVCVDPTSTTLAHKFKPFLSDLYLITPNISEAEVLYGHSIESQQDAVIIAARELAIKGTKVAIITMSDMGVCYATASTNGHIPAIQTEVVDLTGAGDALTAATVFGLLNDLPIDEAIRLGVSAATLTIQSHETVFPDLSLERLYDQLVI